jgi:phospholipase C
MDRRSFLRNLFGAGGVAVLASKSNLLSQSLQSAHEGETALSSAQAPFDHVVLVMMENRSFDHLLGWMPGADGRQAGLTCVDSQGVTHQTYPLAPDYTGCPHPDPDHSWGGGRIQYDSGKMDGFLRSGSNDIFCIGYYGESDLPFYSALARSYTSFDHYFCSILGPTFPNRMFQHAAQTDRLTNSFTVSTLPTIWDRLQQAGVSARYYYSNVPFLGLWGAKYIPIAAPYSTFSADAALGQLPAFSFVDPRYTITDDGTGNDDHPHADMRAGEAFIAEVFRAVTNSPLWPRTVLIFTFDEWGGFFEHVAPPRVIAPNGVDPDLVNGKALLGLRIPPVVVSPFTRSPNPNKPRVLHNVFDHTSALKLLEWRWNLSPLTARDASSAITNLNAALNFQNPQTAVPDLPEPLPYVPLACPQGSAQTVGDTFGSEESVDMAQLQQMAVQYGWPIY